MMLRKIVFVAAAVVVCMGFAANAEVHSNAIGLRVSGGAEVNYQMGMGNANRLEFGLGGSMHSHDHVWYDNGVRHVERRAVTNIGLGVFGAYQWHFNISPSFARGGFNWYFGPGAGVGFWSETANDDYPDYDSKGGMNISGGGQIGIEYDFNALGAPILLSIDSRPTILTIGVNDGGSHFGIGIGLDLALGIRYTF